MTLATLADVLPEANREGYAVAGLVCLGWEDMRAYVAAAEALGAPAILQAGPGCRAHTPLPVLAAMMRFLAERASTPVVAHLDHGESLEICREAIEVGFTSVMFDGSALTLEENIAQTRTVVEFAHAAGVSCEGEIGFVGYDGGAGSRATDPEEARRLANETGLDALAVSVGNTHLQRSNDTRLDRAAIAAIERAVDAPLVIHGGSGVAEDQRAELARSTRIAKFNIGTELRTAFGRSLRAVLDRDRELFDRAKILAACEPAIERAARRAIASLGFPAR